MASPEVTRMGQQDIEQHLEHGCDGPITAFVVMSRCTELVARGADEEHAANALYAVLERWGFLKAADEAYPTGS